MVVMVVMNHVAIGGGAALRQKFSMLGTKELSKRDG
jgi:hypothetical protein